VIGIGLTWGMLWAAIFAVVALVSCVLTSMRDAVNPPTEPEDLTFT
jgi:hypothetical protein